MHWKEADPAVSMEHALLRFVRKSYSASTRALQARLLCGSSEQIAKMMSAGTPTPAGSIERC